MDRSTTLPSVSANCMEVCNDVSPSNTESKHEPQAATAGEEIGRLLGLMENKLVEKEILNRQDIDDMKKQHSWSTERAAAYIEKFILPAHKEGKLDAYMQRELKNALTLLESKYTESVTPHTRDVIARTGLNNITPAVMKFVVAYLRRICDILVFAGS